MATKSTLVKFLRCADSGVECPFEIYAESESEVIRYALLHLESVHGMASTPDETRPLIKEKSWTR